MASPPRAKSIMHHKHLENTLNWIHSRSFSQSCLWESCQRDNTEVAVGKRLLKNWDRDKGEKDNLLFVVFVPCLPGLEVFVPLFLFKCAEPGTILEEERVWTWKLKKMNNNSVLRARQCTSCKAVYFMQGRVFNTRESQVAEIQPPVLRSLCSCVRETFETITPIARWQNFSVQ